MALDQPRFARPRAAPTFAEAAEAHLDDVFGYLLYLTRDRELADDLTGATFERALRHWGGFDPSRGGAKSWLLGVARSTGLDWFRAEARRRRREEQAAMPDEHEAPFVEGLSPALESALASLTPGDRELVALRVVLELDGQATARILGISESAVSTRLSRVLRRLHERMRINEPR